ncbi:hypothetical protein MPDQ_000022 [Monascus purpureus]|uniref:MYND-type zinc finger protein samB n=1 Tax=Monascus purpureus TaxID=5098 RepID=A0A507R5S7_MONPU|nr:hypothetical protein MPDQ_000022 [Monascus purpureus]
MREVNFSIPNVNKASVNITTTLYDRRALDCTSTLPLINSLNHLAYLTTSSARIRDILTVDGGIERLVCILKEGRSKDVMEMWKWSLAFQCVVNIGVRGSESVRTRVVEADMVPVIATLLDNYIKVMEKVRARTDPEPQRHASRTLKPSGAANDTIGRTSLVDPLPNVEQHPSRRHLPPSIEIPQQFLQNNSAADANAMENSSVPRMSMTSPPEQGTSGQEVHNHRPNNAHYQSTSRRFRALQPLSTAMPPMDTADGFGLRPVHDTERIPSMLPRLQTGLASQPESPTTPSGPSQTRSIPQATIRRPRPVISQRPSTSAESDDANGDDSAATGDDNVTGEVAEPIVGLQNQMDIDGVGNRQALLDDVTGTHGLTVTDPSEGQDEEGFNITHHSTVDASIVNNAATTQADGTLGLSPNQTPNNQNSPSLVPNLHTLYLRDRSAISTQSVLTMMPRDEDVLMSLQLLAYVSKYCNLRSYFQRSHFVPKLKIDRELQMLDEASSSSSQSEPIMEEEDEYLLPDDINIFPLVEKFTVRHHSKDMQYWASIVMRNLCRKDESRGGIRQCAYYKCGKWEEFQRQFAKCRRCRRTKYCSKDCQKAAWAYHRHWCHITP